MKRLKDKIDIRYLLAFIVFFIVEAAIALFIRDRLIRPYIGDVLIVVLVYCFIRIFVRSRITCLPLYVFLFAAAVEGLQGLKLITWLHLEDNPLAKAVLGTTFDIGDIVCYFFGGALLTLWQYFEKKYVKRRV